MALAARLRGQDREFVTALTRTVRSAKSLPSHEQAVQDERYLQRWSAVQPAFLAGVRAMRAAVDRHGPPAAD